MTTTRKVNAHPTLGTLQQGDVVLGERVSGTTGLFIVPDLASGGGGAVDSVNGQTGVVILNADDISDAATTNKFTNAAAIAKLATIEAGATADQSALEIKAAYESNADTNAFTDAEQTKVANTSGINTGDQTTIVGITGTKAQFDTAVTDGNILYVGDVTQYTDELAQDAIGAMVDSSLTYVDATPILQRAALTGEVTAAAGSNATTIANEAVTLAKQANVATSSVFYRKTAGTGSPEVQTLATLKTDLGLTGTNSGDQTSIVGISGTKAQFDTACSDGNFVYQSDALGTPSSGVITNLTGDSTGSSTNDNASVGKKGEVITSAVSTVAITSATFTNVTSISLTAGDWDVYGHMLTNPTGTTTQQAFICSISTTSATVATNYTQATFAVAAGVAIGLSARHTRISVSGTTTVYFVGYSTYSVSTLTVTAYIFARRAR